MHEKKTVQLAFEFAATKSRREDLFVVTRTLRQHRLCNSLVGKLAYVRRFFPEFRGRAIRVGLTRAASGMAVPGGDEVWFNPSDVSYHTIAHEFVHLLQGSRDIPTGERSCDLFSLARHWTLNDAPPYYLRVPARLLDVKGKIRPEYRGLICSVAKRAVDLRSAGKRRYIAYFEKTLEEASRSPAIGLTGPGPHGLEVDEPLLSPK